MLIDFDNFVVVAELADRHDNYAVVPADKASFVRKTHLINWQERSLVSTL